MVEGYRTILDLYPVVSLNLFGLCKCQKYLKARVKRAVTALYMHTFRECEYMTTCIVETEIEGIVVPCNMKQIS